MTGPLDAVVSALRRLVGRPAPRPPDQVAALAWREGAAGPEYLLVTSRRSGRWIFPKGGVEAGETPGRAAAREALEEGGVEGRPAERPAGRYRSLKIGAPAPRWLVIELWPVRIERVREDWPEKGQRQRALLGFEAAHRRVDQADMAALLAAFHAERPGITR